MRCLLMSKATETYVEAAKTRNYQKYTVGYRVLFEEGDDVEVETKTWQATARRRALEQHEVDRK